MLKPLLLVAIGMCGFHLLPVDVRHALLPGVVTQDDVERAMFGREATYSANELRTLKLRWSDSSKCWVEYLPSDYLRYDADEEQMVSLPHSRSDTESEPTGWFHSL